jgi:hypothetical protein
MRSILWGRAVLIVAAFWSGTSLAIPAGVMAGSVVSVGPFRTLSLRNGGHVVLRHGPTPRVTVLEGNADGPRVRVEGERLVIDRCAEGCPKGHRLTVEVVAPEIDEIRVEDGGIVATRGDFPRQEKLRAAVEDGGIIDLRSMAVTDVAAAVHSGGRILTTPRGALAAKIAQGGAITYWGTPRVTSSVDHGGVVARGRPGDADRHLEDLDVLDAVVPPVPPAPRRGARGTF